MNKCSDSTAIPQIASAGTPQLNPSGHTKYNPLLHHNFNPADYLPVPYSVIRSISLALRSSSLASTRRSRPAPGARTASDSSKQRAFARSRHGTHSTGSVTAPPSWGKNASNAPCSSSSNRASSASGASRAIALSRFCIIVSNRLISTMRAKMRLISSISSRIRVRSSSDIVLDRVSMRERIRLMSRIVASVLWTTC